MRRQYIYGYHKVQKSDILITPLVFDTGALSDFTPYCSNFLDEYQEIDVTVNAVVSVALVVGYGMVMRQLKTRCGWTMYI